MLRLIPVAVTRSLLRQTPQFIPTTTVREYAKKKEKVLSFKKQQQKKKEQARINAKIQEEKRMEKVCKDDYNLTR
jgi:hypothetical protein